MVPPHYYDKVLNWQKRTIDVKLGSKNKSLLKLSIWDLRGGFTKLSDTHFGGGDMKEGDRLIRNKEENLEIHEKNSWAKKISTRESDNMAIILWNLQCVEPRGKILVFFLT